MNSLYYRKRHDEMKSLRSFLRVRIKIVLTAALFLELSETNQSFLISSSSWGSLVENLLAESNFTGFQLAIKRLITVPLNKFKLFVGMT